MKLRTLAFLLSLVPGAAWAQAQGQQQGYPMTPTGTRYDAAQVGQSSTAAVNNQTTLTFPACPSGQFFYLTMWFGKACLDGTASITNVQQAWTSTNFPALGAQTSVISGSTITTAPGASLCDAFSYVFPTGYKTSTAATATTLVSPAAVAHVSYPQVGAGYCAP